MQDEHGADVPEFLMYSPPTGSFAIRYPSHWNVECDDEGQTSVYPNCGELAVTISSAIHEDPSHTADARQHVRDFSKFAPRGGVTYEDVDTSLARSRFKENDGTRWLVVVKAKQNRVVIATLNSNAREADQAQWAAGESILESLILP